MAIPVVQWSFEPNHCLNMSKTMWGSFAWQKVFAQGVLNHASLCLPMYVCMYACFHVSVFACERMLLNRWTGPVRGGTKKQILSVSLGFIVSTYVYSWMLLTLRRCRGGRKALGLGAVLALM